MGGAQAGAADDQPGDPEPPRHQLPHHADRQRPCPTPHQDGTERRQRDHRYPVFDVDPADDGFRPRTPGQIGDQDQQVPAPVPPALPRQRAHRDVALFVQRQLVHPVLHPPPRLPAHPGGEDVGQLAGDRRDHPLGQPFIGRHPDGHLASCTHVV
ncbi:MAG: hypothetical protein HOY78_26625, partial [Saccharothrix sp.]|nr:hypothetical protein [Saccharothrix sp.]